MSTTAEADESTSTVRAPGRQWPPAFASLNRRNYRLFFVGLFFNSAAVWMQRIAQDWLVLERTNSPTLVGVVTMMQFLPTLLLGMFSGVLADRYPKRWLLLASQGTMMLLAAIQGTLIFLGVLQTWMLFGIALLVGIAFAVDLPVRQSFVNDMVDVKLLANAIGLTAMAFQVGGLVGPALSGLLLDKFGAGYSFAITAASYLVPLSALLRMDGAALHRPPRQAVQARIRTQLAEGLRYVGSRPEIFWMIALIGTMGTVITNLPVTNAAFARLVFHDGPGAGPGGYGLLNSIAAVGSLLGALFAALRIRRARMRNGLLLALMVSVLYVVAAVAPGFYGYAGVLAFLGAATIMMIITVNSLVQVAADTNVRGRVMGIYMLVFVGAGAAGGPAIGAVDQYFGARTGMLLSGLVPGAVTVFIAIMLARRLGLQVRLQRSWRLTELITVTAPDAPLRPVDAPVGPISPH